MALATFHASKLTHEITIRVKGLRTMRLRFWLAAKIFVVGAWIAGCQIEIETEASTD